METIAHSLKPDTLLKGRYRIERVLGEGGFGITYRARDERLERAVVIKEYLPGEMGARAGDAITVRPRTNRENDYRHGLERYLDEAKALAKFTHPNIVQILDYFEANGTGYIVMNYEAGQTLEERLRDPRKPLDQRQILDLIAPLLQGLDKVHQAGLLHRDIKPGNIYLRDEGGPLLIDFGAARHALLDVSRSLSAIVSQGYAPPEQYSSKGKQGPYTDLYALGAVLYRLITGQVPPESVVRSHQLNEDEPDPLIPAQQAGQGRADPWLMQLTGRLLAIKSKERPQSCGEVLQIIQTGGGQPPPDPPPPGDGKGKTRRIEDSKRFPELRQRNRQRQRQTWKRIALAGGGVLALGGLIYFLDRPSPGITTVVIPPGYEQPGQAPTAPAAASPAVVAQPPPPAPPSEAKTYREPTTGMEFVKIEGGSFQMGSPASEADRHDNEKQHRVSVTDFWLAKHEVTNGQYRKFKPGHDSGEGDNLPVVNVSWEEATAYAEWLSKETGKTYRLPTEAEWEYACRAGGQDRYCGGDDLDALAWYDGNSGSKTHPVGGKHPNAWGLYDMSGNVWEWVRDWYGDYPDSPARDPKGPGSGRFRVLRGGGWYDGAGGLRSADRDVVAPGVRYGLLGFRLLRQP